MYDLELKLKSFVYQNLICVVINCIEKQRKKGP